MYIGLLEKILVMYFSIQYWMENNLSEVFTCVNPMVETAFLELEKVKL